MFKILKLIAFLLIPFLIQAVEKERRLTTQEVEKSWRLYALIKYCKNDQSLEFLQKEVQNLVGKGARSNIVFEHDTTALILAQQKKLHEIVALMQNNDPLQNIWNELDKRGIKKSKL